MSTDPSDGAAPAVPADDDEDAEAAEAGDFDEDAGGEESAGLSWGRALVLAAATAFLGFAIAMFVFNRDSSPGADSVDVGFVQDMVSHHEQALELAQIELVNGSDPTVLSFAREVLIFQSMEIGAMKQLLNEWGAGPASPSRDAMAWMGMSTPVDQMPGMATDEQIDTFRSATGSDADAQFLELMAEHHIGGIHMSEYATEHAGTSRARSFAATLAHNQAVEVNEYASLAKRLGLPIDIPTVDVPPAPTG